MRIKLISYNVWAGTYLDELVAFFLKQQADILCLQEVTTKGTGFGKRPEINLYEYLKEKLGIGGVFSTEFTFPINGVELTMGNALLSRFPLTNIEEIEFAAGDLTKAYWESGEYFPRNLVKADAQVNGQLVSIISTHGVWSKHAVVTSAQLNAAEFIRKYCGQFEELIMAGDMNTPYKSQVYTILSSDLTDVSLGEKSTLHPVIHPAGDQDYHVDYVFYKGKGITPLRTEIPVVDASDHLPIVVEFEIE